MKELNDINIKKKELKEKINYNKSIYDGILLKIQMINKELKLYEKENKKQIRKINKINNLKLLLNSKKQTIEEMNSRISELNSEISKIKRNIFNNGQNSLDNKKDNNIAFDGIDEIIKDINNNQAGFEADKNSNKNDDEDYSNIKADIKRNNFANFVFDINQNLNNGKNGNDENDKDFGIESLTKRKPFGDFNFD